MGAAAMVEDDERSMDWSRDRTYSVVVRDDNDHILQRDKDLLGPKVKEVYEDLRQKHSSLRVSVHLDIHQECNGCDGTGMSNLNKRYLCSECDSRGTVTTTEIGIEVSGPPD